VNQVSKVSVKVRRIHPNAVIPRVQQDGDVAADLHAAEYCVIPPRGRFLVKTGLVFELPEGYRARLQSRSGLSLKHGIETGAGLIDNKYRNEIGVVLHNHTDLPFVVNIGDRISQVCIEQYSEPTFVEVDKVEKTARTEGWGSSGT
jgi:dUTP pyrophosphatase